MLLIALTHVRIKQRARVIIYYSIQSILEILSRTPSHTNLGSRLTNTYLRNIIIAKSFLPMLLHGFSTYLSHNITIAKFLPTLLHGYSTYSLRIIIIAKFLTRTLLHGFYIYLSHNITIAKFLTRTLIQFPISYN